MKRQVTANSDERQSTVSVEHVIDELRHRGSPRAIGGLSRFGIKTEKALGVPVPEIRQLARNIGINHGVAEELWKTGIHEAPPTR